MYHLQNYTTVNIIYLTCISRKLHKHLINFNKLAAEHSRLLALRCGTGCHRRLRRHRLWLPSALKTYLFTESYPDIRL